jgi:hypothetical protein
MFPKFIPLIALQHSNGRDSGHDGDHHVSSGLASAAGECRLGRVGGLDWVHGACGSHNGIGSGSGWGLRAVGGVPADNLCGRLAVRAVGDGWGTRGDRIHRCGVNGGDSSRCGGVAYWVRRAGSWIGGSWISGSGGSSRRW